MFHFVGIAVIVKNSMEIANVINIVDTANAADKFELIDSDCDGRCVITMLSSVS